MNRNMGRDRPPNRVGVLVSGGLDSCILVAHLLERGESVQPIYVRCDVAWRGGEEGALRRFLDAIAAPGLSPLITFDQPVGDVYGDHWSVTGRGVPGEHAPDSAVFLPGRNALLLIKPALWCQLQGIRRLALAPLAPNPFADATAAFFQGFEQTLGRSGRHAVRIEVPFADLQKVDVMQLGDDYPLELTFSCLAPRDGLHCGTCNKCGERKRAFRAVDRYDATPYAATVQNIGGGLNAPPA